MAEYTANALQTVEKIKMFILTDAVVCGNNSIVHRDGSGLNYFAWYHVPMPRKI